MNPHKPTFIGSVLKAIACTPNLKLDFDSYDLLVMQPTRQIRALGDELKGQQPDLAKTREVLCQLRDILDAKGLDPKETMDHLGEILEMHQLQTSCSEILESATVGLS